MVALLMSVNKVGEVIVAVLRGRKPGLGTESGPGVCVSRRGSRSLVRDRTERRGAGGNNSISAGVRLRRRCSEIGAGVGG